MSINRTKYLSSIEVGRLIAATKARTTKTGVRAWMVVDFALSTGLRVSEMLIRIEDIDFNRQFIHVHRLKKRNGDGEDILAIGMDLADHLRRYIGDRTQGHLFIGQRGPLTAQGLQRIWRRAIELAGLQSYSIHSARHTIAVHLLKKTGNLRQVQKQLGHASPATTANIYADVSFEDMQEGVTGLYERK